MCLCHHRAVLVLCPGILRHIEEEEAVKVALEPVEPRERPKQGARSEIDRGRCDSCVARRTLEKSTKYVTSLKKSTLTLPAGRDPSHAHGASDK